MASKETLFNLNAVSHSYLITHDNPPTLLWQDYVLSNNAKCLLLCISELTNEYCKDVDSYFGNCELVTRIHNSFVILCHNQINSYYCLASESWIKLWILRRKRNELFERRYSQRKVRRCFPSLIKLLKTLVLVILSFSNFFHNKNKK